MSILRTERRDDPVATIRAAMRGMLSELWSALPGVVETVDLARQTVTVQPTIRERVRLDDGTWASQPLPLLPDVPIVFPAGGGYTLTFPVQPGDECLVVFADRCIDAWWQSGGVQEQAEPRMHDLSDGFAILGPRSQPRRLEGVSADAVQLRSDDGAAFVEIAAAGITLKHPVRVTIDAPAAEVTGTLDVQGLLTYHAGMAGAGGAGGAPTTISGAVSFTGPSLTHNGHNVGGDHAHLDPQGGTTGGPV